MSVAPTNPRKRPSAAHDPEPDVPPPFEPQRRSLFPFQAKVAPAAAYASRTHKRKLVREARAERLSFREAYGALGPPLLAVALICIAWTSWLVFLTLAPNEAANLLMHTTDYDSGQFWLIIEREPLVKWASALAFLVVDVGYIAVFVQMLMFRGVAAKATKRTAKSSVVALIERCRLQNAVRVWADLTGYNARHRKYFNVFLKAGDLVFQGLALRRTLDQGFPDVLAVGYAYFVCLNGLSCVFNIASAKNSAFSEVLIDSVFDLGAAVVFPMAVLGYCSYYFQFDRAVFLINTEVLDQGTFERFARMQADPAQVALFRINFDSLRIKTLLDFTLGIGMNLSFCHRFSRVVEILATRRYRRRSARLGPTILAVTEAKRSSQKPVPRWLALPFLLASVFAVLYTHEAIEVSHEACHAYPQCVAFMHVWNSGVNCSCLMLIDTERTPRTAQEWYSPKDVTDDVRALAVAGTLQGLQLINRQLLQFPEELRGCTDLETISLIYTSTEELPSWLTELKHLKYLHVEGKYGSRNLVTLPSDIFSGLPELAFVHMGNHYHLASIPPFDSAPSLRSLAFAILLSVTELPPLKHLARLESLALVQLPQLAAIPDISELTRLSRLTLYRPNRVCCNGFMGACNLTDTYCMYDPVFDVPGATCLAEDDLRRATPATQHIFTQFAGSICHRSPLPFAIEALSDMPSPERIAVCDGVLYRQCSIPGVTSPDGMLGMCYSARMQVVACNVDQPFIQVRRVQIQRGVGLPCDPDEEAWLGCKANSSAHS